MKNILFILIFLLSLSGFSQEQILNGISLNGPNGFVKAGDLHWNNGNENVMIQSFKGSYEDFKVVQSGAATNHADTIINHNHTLGSVFLLVAVLRFQNLLQVAVAILGVALKVFAKEATRIVAIHRWRENIDIFKN